MTGCCTHCDNDCAEWVGHVVKDGDGRILSVWASGHCPACAERDTIADMCDEEAATAGPERLPDHDARAQTWSRAAALIRGDA